jgi:hypothetical protein
VFFISCEWATVSGAGGSLFIAPTSKRVIGESFTGQVRWTSPESDENLLEAGQGSNKSGPLDKSGEASGVRLESLESSIKPDKSGGAFWSLVKSFWNPMDSLDKSGET